MSYEVSNPSHNCINWALTMAVASWSCESLDLRKESISSINIMHGAIFCANVKTAPASFWDSPYLRTNICKASKTLVFSSYDGETMQHRCLAIYSENKISINILLMATIFLSYNSFKFLRPGGACKHIIVLYTFY